MTRKLWVALIGDRSSTGQRKIARRQCRNIFSHPHAAMASTTPATYFRTFRRVSLRPSLLQRAGQRRRHAKTPHLPLLKQPGSKLFAIMFQRQRANYYRQNYIIGTVLEH
ncbi:hypothetical protein ACU4GD_19470 [Cupriavidus basilensis]